MSDSSTKDTAARCARWATAVWLLAALGVLPALAEDPSAGAEAAAEIAGPEWDAEKGVWRFQVASPYLGGRNAVEVLLPDDFSPDGGRRYRVLYVLPVEPGIGGRYGDGLVEVKKLDVHNRHGLICVAPAFDTVPWFMDHATDPRRRHESHLMCVVLPLVDGRYPTVAEPEGRLLLGFSKSGWGAFTLLLRHPDVFGYAAAWDCPMMLKEEDWDRWGIREAAGTVENFRRYQPARLLNSRTEPFRDRARFALLGHKSFGPGGGSSYQGEHTHTRWAHDTMSQLGIRHAYNNEVIVPHTWAAGWVGPAVEALMSIAEAAGTSDDPSTDPQ